MIQIAMSMTAGVVAADVFRLALANAIGVKKMGSCECDLAWIAGYFDGEGTASIQHTDTGYHIRVSLSNTYKPAVESLQIRFGGRVRAYTKPRKPHHRQGWYWQATGLSAYNFLVQILPYAQEKKPQINEAIDFYALYGGHTTGQNGRTAEQKVDQKARYLRVRTLKRVEHKLGEENEIDIRTA